LASAERALLQTDPASELLVPCEGRIYSLFRVPIPGSGYVNVYGRDATEGERTLAQLRESLADNQALLREVHHRVKNNLQMLCDLMYLQMEAMPDREQHQDLQDAYSRIYAIARLHEQIYQSMQSGQIQLAEYLRRLVTGFTNLYPDVPVIVEAPSDGVLLDLDRAIHVGLIVNELLTNAIKHAFPAGQPGAVTVSVCEEGDRVYLQVQDNGRGLPADFDLEHATSLGLRTVHILARRLEAQVTVTGTSGTSFLLTFPLHADPPLEPK
ncbi:MAG TPA: sensor histidine kinase, partial [Candidatus Sulfotelmatobacter sp.]|nr:sensor histidine kinase [Candidatus Sulfotelmatobacter sp.]